MNWHKSRIFRKRLWFCSIVLLWLIEFNHLAIAAGINDPAPTCSATDIQYSVSNVVPSGFCYYSGAVISVSFDVNLWQPQTGYNLAIAQTAAGNATINDVGCLASGIDLDSSGCDDYNGTGTATNPTVAQATLNVSCGLPNTNDVAPIDLYLNYETNSGGTSAQVSAPDCLLLTGIDVPYKPASLRLSASVINDNGGTANPGNWALTANLGNGAHVYTGTGYYTGDGHVFAGDYVLSGSGPAGYTLDEINCTGTTLNAATSTMELKPGESGHCVLVYNDIGVVIPSDPTITLYKTIINDDAGIGVVDDFDISIDGVEVIAGIATTVASGTNVIISELDLPDYTEGVWSCGDNAGITTNLPSNGPATGTTLNLQPGSEVVCKIVNNDIAAQTDIDLVINKSVSDTSPSIGDNIRFFLNISNTGTTDAVDVTATDILPAGLSYVPGSILGGSSTSDASPSGSGLAWTINSLPSGANTLLSYDAIVLAP